MFCRHQPASSLKINFELMPVPPVNSVESSLISAGTLLLNWVHQYPDSPAVQALTPAAQAQLLAVFQHILVDRSDINVDEQDIRTVLHGAMGLQFGMATCSGPDRAEALGHQLWAEATELGATSGLIQRMLLSIQSGPTPELDMDELTWILEYCRSQAGDQAEVVFGHGLKPALGASVEIMMLVNRH
jgi:cell division GTPase FtsZ